MTKGKMNNSGITLIALVLTIIVLLILAGVSIAMLSGDNSILQKATDAKTNTDNAQIKEKIQLAYHSALTGGQGSYTKESLEDELEKEFGENNYNVDDSNNKNWILSAKGQSVTILAGKKSTEQSSKLSEEQLKAIIESKNEDCMIDENGNSIPFDVWRYRLNNTNETASLEGIEDDDDDASYADDAYNRNIADRKLEYEIPVFIKKGSKTYKVTELGEYALSHMNLQTISIPNTINTIGWRAFQNSTIDYIEIPDSVLTIGTQAFHVFDGNVQIGKGVKTIKNEAFSGSRILSITIPENVITVQSLAFYQWKDTQTINVPFTENNRPDGWNDGWDDFCHAIINYAE